MLKIAQKIFRRYLGQNRRNCKPARTAYRRLMGKFLSLTVRPVLPCQPIMLKFKSRLFELRVFHSVQRGAFMLFFDQM
ncbi:hypothetical protein BEN74_04560 [Acinetobacter sp. WCHAc010034]|nr:hypothetical protein BEN74_04560 [Acinetobacter sp. WCHAc010034]